MCALLVPCILSDTSSISGCKKVCILQSLTEVDFPLPGSCLIHCLPSSVQWPRCIDVEPCRHLTTTIKERTDTRYSTCVYLSPLIQDKLVSVYTILKPTLRRRSQAQSLLLEVPLGRKLNLIVSITWFRLNSKLLVIFRYRHGNEWTDMAVSESPQLP
jgi:hypothetical protein